MFFNVQKDYLFIWNILTSVGSRNKFEHSLKTSTLNVLIRFEVNPQMTVGRSDTRRKLVQSTKLQQPVVKSILSISDFQIVVFAVRWLFDLEIVPKIQLYHMVFRCWNKRKVSLKLRWQNTKNIIEISDFENDNDWTRNNKTLKPSSGYPSSLELSLRYCLRWGFCVRKCFH